MTTEVLVEGNPVTAEATDEGKLAPGGHARIFRDGGVLEGMVEVPASGPMVLRHLAPGVYVARDEQGNSVAFEVSAHSECVTVQDGKGDRVTGAEPGSSRVDVVEAPSTVPADPTDVRPSVARAQRLSEAKAARDDVRAPGAPGSADVQEVPSIDPNDGESAEDRQFRQVGLSPANAKRKPAARKRPKAAARRTAAKPKANKAKATTVNGARVSSRPKRKK